MQQYSQPSYNVSLPSNQYQPQLTLPLSSAIPSYGSYPTGQHVSQVNATAALPPAASLEQPPLQLLPSLNAGHLTTNPYSVGSYVSHDRTTELPRPMPSLAPPPPLPISSTINRPKVSNAYDPPFPPVSFNRRNGRAAVNQKTAGAYSTYTLNQESESQIRTSSTYTGEYGPSRTLPSVQNAIQTETTSVYNHNCVAEAQAPRWDIVNQAVSESGSTLAPGNEQHGYGMFDQTRKAALSHKPDTYSSGENGYSTGYHHSTATQSAAVPLGPHCGEMSLTDSVHEAALERASLHLQQEQSTRSYSINTDNSAFDDDPAVPTQYAHDLHHALSDAHLPSPVDDQRMGLPCQPFFPDEPISKGLITSQITHNSYVHHSEVVEYNSFSSNSRNHDNTVNPYSPNASQPPIAFTESSSAPSLHDAHVSKHPLSYEGPSDLKSSSPSNSALNSLEDPYAPTNFQVNQETEYGLSTDPNYTSPTQDNLRKPTLTTIYDHHLPQEVAVAPPYTPYAPSPSLIGSNDPLARTTANIPIVSFGFGGRLVTCFHGADSLNTGFDIALSARNSTSLKIHGLKKLIPESVLDSSGRLYPGPLLSDPGTPTTSIVRTGMSTQTKTKKSRVIKYLDDRGNEIHQGIGYLTGMEKRKAEGKLVLVKLLKIMVEHDGKLLGT